jgi:hypothetical protein
MDRQIVDESENSPLKPVKETTTAEEMKQFISRMKL